MVYTGKPSAGCENCRKAKKRCDQGVPSCERCTRLGKSCGGYRDLNDFIFKDETSNIARRVASGSETGTSSSTTLTRQPSPDSEEEVAKQFFFREFVTAFHFSFLEGVSSNEFLSRPIIACATAAAANRANDQNGRERSRQYYIDAITATNAAIRDSESVQQDDTLVAVYLLACYERISWDIHISDNPWKHHVEGAAQVLWLRGPDQIKTRTGAVLFREVRDSIVNNCNLSEQEVPNFITEWTKLLPFDSVLTPLDQMTLLASRAASLRAGFRTGSISDTDLAAMAEALERDLLKWARSHSVPGSVCAFESVRDVRSPRSWNGQRHVYGSPQAQKHWDKWRIARILVSRVQEALWRRSWPVLALPERLVPAPEHFQMIRHQISEEMCVAAAHDLGNDETTPPSSGSVASGLLLTISLALAGTCVIEQLVDPTVSPGGRRLIHMHSPLHLDPFNQASTQLAWIVGRLDYIAGRVGVRWASTMSSFLKGETGVYYEICRSHIVRNDELDAAIFGDVLDLELGSLGSM